MMLFIPKQRKYNAFLTPPPSKKVQGNKRSRYGYTHMCLLIPAACDLDIYEVDFELFGTVKLQSNPFIENYILIIVVFSRPHFSICHIVIKKKTFQRKGKSLLGTS